MKKILAMLLTLVLCLSFCACQSSPDSPAFDQDSYDTYLSGKQFESAGRVLTFDHEGSMTYTYTNMMGDTFRYTYSILEINKYDDNITMLMKQVFANNDRENTDEDEEIEVIYHISDDKIEYYSNLYDHVN
jgi:hypothetical protein